MNTLEIKKLPTVFDLFLEKDHSIKKWYFGVGLTYLIIPSAFWLWIVEKNIIIPVGVDSPLLRLFCEVIGWAIFSGLVSAPLNIYKSRRVTSIFQIIIFFVVPFLFWKFMIS